ncbi:MAG: type IV toxin-antitoxin system AbiEi family antitoxin domain-containing protein [bacterium]|nr:type IV toxin-antitoxin system AbiEi family antitoxin domain-containing protein [bacterium]
MNKGDYISAILRAKGTVFTASEIMLIWNETGSAAARARINYYARNGDIYRIRRGIYAKDKDYNRRELATKVYIPSYVSFETVLAEAGIISQFYKQIFVASYLSRELEIGGQKYAYKHIKDEILTNPSGIVNDSTFSTASAERAFLDVLYLNVDYHFDNLRPLNWERVFELLPIYGGIRRMEEVVRKIYKSYQTE